MIGRKITNYGLAALMFIGSYTIPVMARAQAVTNTVKQEFFDTIVDYTRKQGLNLNKINANKVQIKEKVVTEKGEAAYGTFHRITRKIELQDSNLESIATVCIHEVTHEKMYNPELETEMWFEKVPYKLEQNGDVYTATLDITKPRKLPGHLSKLIIKEDYEGVKRKYTVYDSQGNQLTSLELTKIVGKDGLVFRTYSANYPLMGVQGEFFFAKEDKLFYYMPSDLIEFYNEIIARVYEQIFSGYYHGLTSYKKRQDADRSILGKSLEYLATDYNLPLEQQKISKNAEDAYSRLNEDALVKIVEKTIQLGGRTFGETMEDLQDEDFAKSISLGSIILTKDGFDGLLELYDTKGKEAVKKLMGFQLKELQQTKAIGPIKENEIIRGYIKRFNLSDEEVEYVLKNTKAQNFTEMFNSKDKIRYIERIKQQNLERLLGPFKKDEKTITKGL